MTNTDSFNKIPPHDVIQSWLGPRRVEQFLRFAQSNEYSFEDTKVTHRESGRVDRTRRVSKKLSLGDLKSEVRARVEEFLPVMFGKLGIKPFTPGRIELELVAHGEGAFFERHMDTLAHQDGRHRVISAVYYFYTLPKAFSGGLLRLHSLAATGLPGTFIDIAPEYDTLVFFPSFFPHEVLPVKCPSGRFLDSRFAINIWIHRR